MRCSLFALSMLLFTAGPALAQTPAAPARPPSIQDLAFLVGEWEGRGDHLNPREAQPRVVSEDVTARCDWILKKQHIQCHMIWTRPNRPGSRELFLTFSLNQASKMFESTHLYDGPYDKVQSSYTRTPDGALVALVLFEDGGVRGVERVEWRVSADGREITGTEANHRATDPAGYWARSFVFTWRRKGG